jgi:hypothetical protein
VSSKNLLLIFHNKTRHTPQSIILQLGELRCRRWWKHNLSHAGYQTSRVRIPHTYFPMFSSGDLRCRKITYTYLKSLMYHPRYYRFFMNYNQLDVLFIFSLLSYHTSTCFGRISSPSSGGRMYICVANGTC